MKPSLTVLRASMVSGLLGASLFAGCVLDSSGTGGTTGSTTGSSDGGGAVSSSVTGFVTVGTSATSSSSVSPDSTSESTASAGGAGSTSSAGGAGTTASSSMSSTGSGLTCAECVAQADPTGCLVEDSACTSGCSNCHGFLSDTGNTGEKMACAQEETSFPLSNDAKEGCCAAKHCAVECNLDTGFGGCAWCFDKNDCGGTQPFCTGGLCVQCNIKDDCTKDTPVCNGNACVGCAMDTDCSSYTTTPHCQNNGPAPHGCVECNMKSDCTNNKNCTNNKCT